MREGLNQSEINRAARLLRGGEPWDDIREQFDGVAPETMDRFRADLERLAARPGPVDCLPTPEQAEQNLHEHQRLDALFPPRRQQFPFVVKRAIGR